MSVSNSTLALDLFKLYSHSTKPPFFSLISFQSPIDYEKYAPAAKIYCDQDDDQRLVKLVSTHRQPANIQMMAHFNETGLEKITGISKSGYTFVYDEYCLTGDCILPPNIGVYTLTKVHDKTLKKYYNDVHIYHAVGYAFDCKSQVDYQVLTQFENLDEITRSLYRSVFIKIFECAIDHKLDHVIMSLIGANNFASEYPGGIGHFKVNVWAPAFREIAKLYQHITVDGMGTGWPADVIGESYGNFPTLLQDLDLKKTLIVNSWDPHSVIGNGNKSDDSLDGHVGRSCNSHFFGWGLTNPYLLANLRQVDTTV